MRNSFLARITNEELKFLALIHPKCADSPFATTNGNFEWIIKDVEKENKVRAFEKRNLIDLQKRVIAMSEESPALLSRKARGLIINGSRILLQDWDDKDSVLVEVMDIMAAHPDAFSLAFESNDTAIRGLVSECLEKGLLRYKAQGEQIVMTLNGSQFCAFSKQIEPISGTTTFINEQNNFQSLISQLEGALNPKNPKVK
jgi:hypothetical protein